MVYLTSLTIGNGQNKPPDSAASRFSPRLYGQSGYYSAAIALLSLLLAVPALAARVPDAGSLENQLRQSSSVPVTEPLSPRLTLPEQQEEKGTEAGGNSVTVVIKQIQFQGLEGTPVSEMLAQQVLASFLHQPQNFAGLRKMVALITSLCRSYDMPLAYAVLPPQTIKDGTLTIQVIPGRYDHGQVSNQTGRIRDQVIGRILRTQAPSGTLILRSRLERTALLLGNIPGIQTNLVLQPGALSGTSLINAEIEAAERYRGFLSLDNLGDPVIGRSRAVVSGQINGLFGLGDQLQLNLLNNYEKNGILTGTLDYSLLAGGYGTRAGLNYSYLDYHYYLQGVKFNGYSANWNLYTIQPWILRPRARVEARLDAGQQRLADRFPAVLNLPGRWREINTGSLAVSGSLSHNANGLLAFTLRGTGGKVNNADSSASGNGHFSRFYYQLSQTQYLFGPLSLYSAIKGQLASNNLDSSQKLLLGGADAVRAYDTGSGAVDDGYVLNAELRSHWTLPVNLFSGQPELTIAVFYDQATGFQFKNNLNPQTGMPFVRRDNRLTLAGAGAYLSLALPGNYALTMTYARRTGNAEPVSGYRGRERLWLSAVKAF